MPRGFVPCDRSPFALALLVALAGCGGPIGATKSHGDGGAHPVSDGASGGSCGACPAGYSCGSANGVAVCRAPSGIPLFRHVFVIVMENTSLATLQQSGNTPYLHSLMGAWATASDYHGVAHPSLPNYVALTTGDTQGISCDCNPMGGKCNALTCNVLLHSCGCSTSAMHLGDQLDAAGLGWRAYAEDMGNGGCLLTDSGNFAVRHVPFLYFPDVQNGATPCSDRVVDYSQFAADLAAGPRAFSFIAPNLVDDMHDPVPAGAQNYANGDTWLAGALPPILASPAFLDRGALFVVWDEDDLSGLLAKDDPIPLFVLSPLAKAGGYVSATQADHYALLATIEDGLGVPRLGNAAGATPLADFFPDK